jgi:hypothetical protein
MPLSEIANGPGMTELVWTAVARHRLSFTVTNVSDLKNPGRSNSLAVQPKRSHASAVHVFGYRCPSLAIASHAIGRMSRLAAKALIPDKLFRFRPASQPNCRLRFGPVIHSVSVAAS